jgi:uncharacterized protein YggE
MSESNKQYYAIAIIAIIALAFLDGMALYYGFSKSTGMTVSTAKDSQNNVISVSGTGSAYAAPDIAFVSVTISTQSTMAVDAQQKNSETTNNVIEALRAIGVSRDDLATETYSLRPIYEYDKQQRVVGYECRNSLRVTWRKIYEVGIVLDTAVKAGANNIGGVTFSLSKQKMDTVTADAIREAAADADAKAQALAAALKLTIVGKSAVSLGTAYAPRAVNYELKADTTPIIPGELRVTVTINVNYRFA